jgi:tetratricopeptide (TPR) repeat protein
MNRIAPRVINPQTPSAADRVLAKLESLQRAGRLEEAERSCRNALIEHPANAQILRRFGLILGARGRADEALDALRRATEADPACVDCFVTLAALLNDLGRSAEALEASERGLALDPDSYFAIVCRALVLHRLGRLDESIAVWRHAIDLQPRRVQAHAGLAEALLAADQPAEAERAARRALELHPDHPQALFALGNAFYFTGRVQDAIEPLHRALARKPGTPAIALNLALAYLTLGRYAEAWPHYEMRLNRSPEKNLAIGMTYAQPPWNGSEPHGKTVLVHAEQGFGDILQFVRFLPALAERGVQAILRVDRKLRALLQHSFPGIPIVPLDEPPPEFDAWLPLASLGRLLSVSLESLPGSVSYLSAESKRSGRGRKSCLRRRA